MLRHNCNDKRRFPLPQVLIPADLPAGKWVLNWRMDQARRQDNYARACARISAISATPYGLVS
jgi:hypothetical protein